MISIKNMITLIYFLAHQVLRLFFPHRSIEKIHSITFRQYSPEGGRGGGAAVQTCQQILLGNRHENYDLYYTYHEENKYSIDKSTRLSDLWGATFFAIKHTALEQDAAYITHDYGTAFGLAILGKRFIYISHLQGPRVEEKISFNEFISKTDAMIIKFCENYVFKRAFYVCFPSTGAMKHYFSSKHRSIEYKETRIGPTLYNTLYANPEITPYNDLKRDDDVITFISIGALTNAKGVDLIPEFFQEYLRLEKRNVRWIIIGEGALENNITSNAELLINAHQNFSYIHIKSCSYAETNYLMDISDIYIMYHRVSIFDFATLEAMKKGKAIILSGNGGNIEFNVEDNIVIHNGDNHRTSSLILNLAREEAGNKNKEIYDKYFSNERFIVSYKKILDNLSAAKQ